MALYALLFLGSTPVGGPVLGWIAEQWGPRAGLALGGAVSLAAALAGVSVLRIRRTAGPQPTGAGEAGEVIVAA
jgi:hypothetical protein